MDLCGPLKVQRRNGKKYILVIVDDYSRYTSTRFLRSKADTAEELMVFFKMIQTKLNQVICNIRSDHGTEFENSPLDKFCMENDGSLKNDESNDDGDVMKLFKSKKTEGGEADADQQLKNDCDDQNHSLPEEAVEVEKDDMVPGTTQNSSQSTSDSQENDVTLDEEEHVDQLNQLNKALYDLKQAPRAWYERLSKFSAEE
nr:uncharacterized protein LOC112941713 [Solanum lycopersicum]